MAPMQPMQLKSHDNVKFASDLPCAIKPQNCDDFGTLNH